MGRKRLALSESNGLIPSIVSDRKKQSEMTLAKFFDYHKQFISSKLLEGLSSRTLKDHELHMSYFKKYLVEEQRINLDRYVDIDIFRGYLMFMVTEKRLNPCTINIRLRTLKCYLKWLFDEGHMEFNYSLKLKLVKTPEDTIKPLSDSDVKKMLKAPDKSTYSGYRDFSLMVLMLDCGIRVGEAMNLKISDVDLKTGLINVRAESAKTRIFRQLPISPKTCKLMKELVKIAQDNKCDYIFQSTYGGHLDKNVVIQNFEKYGKKAGLKVRCTPHVWRHTFSTNFVKSQNGDIFTLQRMLGHATLDMCRKYVQLENTDLIRKHDQAELLNKYLQ